MDRSDPIDTLAQIIRQVDGSNQLGAGALAEAILTHPDFFFPPHMRPEPEPPSAPVWLNSAEASAWEGGWVDGWRSCADQSP